jgi:hypothetical protein
MKERSPWDASTVLSWELWSSLPQGAAPNRRLRRKKRHVDLL